MAVAFVAGSYAEGFSSATVTVPSGLVAGNIILALVLARSAPTPPSGWTVLQTSGNGGNGIAIIAWHLFASGETSYTFSGGSTVDVELVGYSGNVATPVDASAIETPVLMSPGSTYDTPTVTTTLASDYVVSLWLCSFTGPAWSSLSTTSVDYDPSGGPPMVAAGSVVQASAGTSTSQSADRGTLGGSYSGVTAQIALATIAVPLAPTLVSPSNGAYMDLSGTPTFSWSYNNTDGTTQADWAFERNTGGGAFSYWSVSSSAWEGSIVWNPGTSGSYTFPSGAWANSTSYTWSVNTESSASLTGSFATPFTLTGEAAPTLTVNDPTGTQTVNNPTVSWTPSFPATAPTQVSYRAVVYSAAQYGAGGFSPGSGPSLWDSGVVASTAVSVASSGLPLTGTCRAYVQVADAHQLSPWEYSGFTQSVSPPNAPTLTAVWTESTASTLLTATATGGYTGAAGTMTIWSSDDSGATWQWVRGGSAIALATPTSQVTLTDYEGPAMVVREYQATVSDMVSGSTLTSSPSTTHSVTSTIGNWWLKNPLSPTQNTTLIVSADHATYQLEQSTVNYPLGTGTTYPTVQFGSIGGNDGSVTVTTTTPATDLALKAILASQAVLLLQTPFGDNWYVRGAISMASGSTTQKQTTLSASSAASPFRQTVFSYIEIGIVALPILA